MGGFDPGLRNWAANRLKGFRAVATRYEKRAYIYLGTVSLAALMGLIVPHRKRPGRPLFKGEEEDNAQHRKVRARVEHTFSRMKN